MFNKNSVLRYLNLQSNLNGGKNHELWYIRYMDLNNNVVTDTSMSIYADQADKCRSGSVWSLQCCGMKLTNLSLSQSQAKPNQAKAWAEVFYIITKCARPVPVPVPSPSRGKFNISASTEQNQTKFSG